MYIHSVLMQRPWLVGCRFMFAATYSCLSTASLVSDQPSLCCCFREAHCPKEWAAPGERGQRLAERAGGPESVGWDNPQTVPAPASWKSQIQFLVFYSFILEGATVLSFKYTCCFTRKWGFWTSVIEEAQMTCSVWMKEIGNFGYVHFSKEK